MVKVFCSNCGEMMNLENAKSREEWNPIENFVELSFYCQACSKKSDYKKAKVQKSRDAFFVVH